MTFTCTLLVSPHGKGRPRFDSRGGGRSYTPEKTRMKSDEVRYWLAKEQPPKFEGAVHIDLLFVFPFPVSMSKKKRETAYPTRYDVDNLAKLVMDSANHILWDDDKQVVSAMLKKEYGDPPRIEVLVRPA